MRNSTFTFTDIQEIGTVAYGAFISTFLYEFEESESDYSDNLDSDFSDFDPDIFGCGEITPAIESMVEDTWEICNPLDDVYGATASEMIKETVKTATEAIESPANNNQVYQERLLNDQEFNSSYQRYSSIPGAPPIICTVTHESASMTSSDVAFISPGGATIFGSSAANTRVVLNKNKNEIKLIINTLFDITNSFPK